MPTRQRARSGVNHPAVQPFEGVVFLPYANLAERRVAGANWWPTPRPQ